MNRFIRYTTRLGHVAALAIALLVLLPAAARGADSTVEGMTEGESASRASAAVDRKSVV